MPPARDREVPPRLRRAADLSWRVLVVGFAAWVLLRVVLHLRVVVVPVLLATLAATVLVPPVQWLRRRGWPSLAATWAVFLGVLLLLAGLLVAVVVPAWHQVAGAETSFQDAGAQLRGLLRDGPLNLSDAEIDDALDAANRFVRENGRDIARNVASGARMAGEAVAALLLALVLTFFFVKDGEQISEWVSARFGAGAGRARDAGSRAAVALRRFALGTTVNGLVEGTITAVALLVLGVPLALPLALLTFLGAYIPFVGALLAGTVATVVALLTEGPTTALVVAVVYVVLQQVEGDLLHPLILGRAVRLHPVAVLLAVTTGVVLAGLLGAFLAVPLVAAVRAALAAPDGEPAAAQR